MCWKNKLLCVLGGGVVFALLGTSPALSAQLNGRKAGAVATKKISVGRPGASRADSFSLLQVNTKNLTFQDDVCSVRISYPSFGNVKADAEISFWANNLMQTFLNGVKSLASQHEGRYSMHVDYTVEESSPSYVSVVFRTKTQTPGAESVAGLVTFTYSLSNGCKLDYADIFEKESDLMYFLSLYTRGVLLEKLGHFAKASIDAGTVPDPLSFSLFALQPKGIKIFFPAYQVADKIYGEQEVFVPLEKMRVFKPRMEIWGQKTAYALPQ